jgi:amidase
LSDKALNGARIGVYRNHGGAGVDARVERILEDTIETLRSLGAEIVDPVEVDREGMGSAQHEVLVYEFKADLNAYLENSGAPINNLAGIIEFNKAHADTVMPHFGQETLIEAQAKGPLTDDAYLEALAESKRIARNGIDNALETHNLDALIAPTRGTAWLTGHINGDQSTGIYSSSLAAISGYASITVPAGDILGLPIGISFIGTAYSDEKLIKLAYAFEQGGYKRRPPFKNQ